MQLKIPGNGKLYVYKNLKYQFLHSPFSTQDKIQQFLMVLPPVWNISAHDHVGKSGPGIFAAI